MKKLEQNESNPYEIQTTDCTVDNFISVEE